MMTRLHRAIAEAATALARAGVNSPRGDAEELAAHAARTTRSRLFLFGVFDEEFFGRYAELIAARSRRIPLQHLTGTAAFGPLELHVGPGVFTPRPETEALLDWATKQKLPDAPVIVDLCTGSGALALALARHRTNARVIGVDNSADALTYARRNAAGTDVELRDGDVTDTGLFDDLDGQVDLIVANPPYLPDGVSLEPEVAQYDPSVALFGGADGMTVIAAIVGLASRWLLPGGLIAVEHDETTAGAAVELLDKSECFAEVTSHNDLAGRPRFVTARRRAA